MTKEKKWLIQLVVVTSLLFIPIVGIVLYKNYTIDPLWNFTHEHEWNTRQHGFDERQLKTNYLQAHQEQYDSLLMGSSRVTYMNEHHFKQERVFNYSVSQLTIAEYIPYIRHAEKQNGKPFEKVYIELYLEGVNKELKADHPPEHYFTTTQKPFYRWSSLFSKSTTDRAQENKALSLAKNPEQIRMYDRHNVGTTTISNAGLLKELATFDKKFEEIRWQSVTVYNDSYREQLQQLIEAFPHIEWVVFTNPVVADRFVHMMRDPLYWSLYERWYGDLVEVFDEVISFQGVTRLTSPLEEWFDTLHYYPSVGDEMIAVLEQSMCEVDVCKKVTKESKERYLKEIQRQIYEWESREFK